MASLKAQPSLGVAFTDVMAEAISKAPLLVVRFPFETPHPE